MLLRSPVKGDRELIIGSVKIKICDNLGKSPFSAMVGTQAHWSGLKRGPWGDEKVESFGDGEQSNRMVAVTERQIKAEVVLLFVLLIF